MSAQKDREESAIRYLLGGLSESERTSLEEKFFADDKEFEELEIAEGELVDRYVRRELSAADRFIRFPSAAYCTRHIHGREV